MEGIWCLGVSRKEGEQGDEDKGGEVRTNGCPRKEDKDEWE